jgi:CBS domain-containing protein
MSWVCTPFSASTSAVRAFTNQRELNPYSEVKLRMVFPTSASKAKDIMSSPAIYVMEETPVREIARVLLQKEISAVPVINTAGRLVGIVSEGDLIGRRASDDSRRSWWLDLLEAGPRTSDTIRGYLEANGLRAKDVMTKDVITVQPDEPITRVAELLSSYNIKRFPVVSSGQMLGVVSRADVLRYVSKIGQ